MPQSPNVLIATGMSEHGHIPQQDYANLFTKYNLEGSSDADFYNKMVQLKSIENFSENKITPSDPSQHYEFDIYGFLPANCKYTYTHSIRQIVNFFQRHEKVELVICDIIEQNNAYQHYQYIHSASPQNNIPFFIRNSVVNNIEFKNEDPIFQNQLNILKQKYIIFHIAEPLITMVQEGSG